MITKAAIKNYIDISRTLIKTEDYLYVLPHPLLKNYISNYTITFPGSGTISQNYTVIPNGSGTLLFSFDGNQIQNGLFGPATIINAVGESANTQQLIFIIEFYPHGLIPFTRIVQDELKDRLLPLDDITPSLYRLLYNAFDQARDAYDLLSKVDQILLSCVQNYTLREELNLSLDKIISNSGNISVKELATAAVYSERHLNRLFRQYVGVSIKTLSSLIRLNKSIRLLQGQQLSITHVSHQMGYYDEAHFIHSFKSVCGITPQNYLKNMSDYYNEIAKF